ncbi:hypothetical protein LTR64_008681 [Lithohypha guttulata]|uniref:uncharacterized protein n=1 Tax=Lithohypha guttulata TaxID=1690604 RepID=UPI002DE0C56E|nr:hypothetical protein LTR51_008713 [Lithohypha guttulata]
MAIGNAFNEKDEATTSVQQHKPSHASSASNQPINSSFSSSTPLCVDVTAVPPCPGTDTSEDSNDDARERAQVEKKLVRKLDICLLPVLIVMCAFSIVDKSGISVALIDNLKHDIHITQTQFNIGIGLFNLGTLLFQLPSNLLITRVRPSVYLSFCCLAWSLVSACHAIIHDYPSYTLVRVFLGIAEAPFFVGAVHVMSSWYTRRELALRNSFILGAIILTLTFISPLSGGILQALGGKNGWAGWRWLYLLYGVCGFAPAIAGFCLLPDYPGSKRRRWWLTEQEQVVAQRRIKEDRVNEREVERKKLATGLVDALKDKRTWIFVMMLMARKSLEGLYIYLTPITLAITKQLFPNSSIDMKTLSLIIGSPPALLAAILALFFAYTSDRYSERTFHLAVPLVFALIGTITSAASLNPVARYVSSYLYLAGHVAGTALLWSWVPGVIQETPEKKACGIAIVNVLGGLGGLWSPFLFRGRDMPRYPLAFAVISGFIVVDIACCFVMRSVLKKQNQRLKDKAQENATEEKVYVL